MWVVVGEAGEETITVETNERARGATPLDHCKAPEADAGGDGGG